MGKITREDFEKQKNAFHSSFLIENTVQEVPSENKDIKVKHSD